MKGNIRIGAKVYKISDKNLSNFIKSTYEKEKKKIELKCKIIVKENKPVKIEIQGNNTFSDINILLTSEIIPTKAFTSPITEDRIRKQISKTGNTPFSFSSINIELDNNLHISSISDLNDLRRTALDIFSQKILESKKRKKVNISLNDDITISSNITKHKKISLLLNTLNCDFDYSNLEVDRIYIPLSLFTKKEYKATIMDLVNKFDTYIYMPNIIRNNYKNLLISSIDNIISQFQITGFVVSNLSQFNMLSNYKNLKFIGNYTLNVFNNKTCYELKTLDTITLSPELNKKEINAIKTTIPLELIVYGRLPLMSSRYCFMGGTNKCYPECTAYCKNNSSYYLKDRLGFLFPIMPDNLQTVTTIYNSKITSITYEDLNIDWVRIDILDESASEIKNIINAVRNGKKIEGNSYTNGNINREV